jgi:hypothetical protein
MIEPKIQIGDYVLSEAQAMAVRVAVTSFYAETGDEEIGFDLGPIADAYHARLGEVLTVMTSQARK